MARPFGYQMEKFTGARSSLMAPHYAGEDQSFASAIQYCHAAFGEFHDLKLIKGEDILEHLETVRRLMSTSGVADPTDEGTYLQRARQMTMDERDDFSKAVDELANFFYVSFFMGEPFE